MVMTYARRGIRLVGNPVVIDALAGNAGALAVFQVSNWAQQIGAKTVILKRLFAWNNGAGNTVIHIGRGAAGAVVDAFPPIYTITNLNAGFVELEVPEVEFSVDIMAWGVAIPLTIQVEVEELS